MYQSQSKKYELAVNFLYMPLDELDVYYDLQNIKKILLNLTYILSINMYTNKHHQFFIISITILKNQSLQSVSIYTYLNISNKPNFIDYINNIKKKKKNIHKKGKKKKKI
ncbi:hypothetical protein PFAG_01148 [Plasmodium falciparum Santa Lucia]|uniref:Uncharacterized protein n=1 Tax=Plasmodium falciparum Santa Lucia TaxID=478859 RepID=W7G397_PLAFA|nr:hypothetical protein PFAG_01148 [Plasmodium falciparum Santa Lucia]